MATANTIPLDINTGTAGADSGFVNGGGGQDFYLQLPKFIRNTYRKSYITYQFTEIPLTLFSNTEVLPNFIALCSFLGWKYGPL